ncbi:MAG: flavodoxin-dependent (E)-4-hydroxy-3-methylbut-2-enyl-diphosphate synthase [Clostridia bacterium]|nr:flavodoxin-dependent (E)-4-hydroxy-3-methylbut-2-enyl-diphosphate synthase [Clostridia bacterium]
MTMKVFCGDVQIGGGAPISIQSMTNTNTADVKATTKQICELADAGCQIVRLAVPDMEAAEAFREIRKNSPVPLVADIHFDYRLAIAAIRNGADKIRINPGNIGSRDRVEAVVREAKAAGIPIRVGVNSGSLEKSILEKYGRVTAKGLAESAMNNVKLLESMDFEDIVVSLKSSDVIMNYEAHKIISKLTQHPLHIGVTEAGTPARGEIKSAAGIGALLLEGIGDTMRVSLTGDPVREVIFAKKLLAEIGIRKDSINIVSCPTCGRTKVNLEAIVNKIEAALMPLEKERAAKGLKGITVAVMGCAVNGPGEAKEADLGVACGDGKGLIFIKGETVGTVDEKDIAATLTEKIRNYESL